MNYVVAGATSGTGNEVISRLASKVGAQNLTCIVRPSSDREFLESIGVKVFVGDVTCPDSFISILKPETIYLDMTNPRFYDRSLAALTSAGVKRAYFVTTTGVYSKYRRCASVYRENEDRIRRSSLAFTILRPSMIYGSMRDKNMHKLVKFLDRSPVFPYFGDGTNLMQPVYAPDLADGIVSAMMTAGTEYQDYDLAGPDPISYSEIVNLILSKLGRKVRTIELNPDLAWRMVKSLQWIPGFPINDEQVLRLREDKVFDITKAVSELGYSPRAFDKGISLEIGSMVRQGVVRS